MKKSEALKLIKVIADTWPRDNFPAASQLIYATAIADLDFESTAAGVNDLMAERERLPSIAAIRKASRARSGAVDGVLWDSEWSRVLSAASSRGRDREPGWTDPRTRAAVRAIGWRELCLSHQNALPTIRAQFRDIWNGHAEKARTEASQARGALEGETVSSLVAGVAKKLRAPE